MDALSDTDLASVIMPFDDSLAALKLGKAAELAWQDFANAATAEQSAIAVIETEFLGD